MNRGIEIARRLVELHERDGPFTIAEIVDIRSRRLDDPTITSHASERVELVRELSAWMREQAAHDGEEHVIRTFALGPDFMEYARRYRDLLVRVPTVYG